MSDNVDVYQVEQFCGAWRAYGFCRFGCVDGAGLTREMAIATLHARIEQWRMIAALEHLLEVLFYDEAAR